MSPRVSVITTVYDRTDCLARCLKSMRHLHFREFEHIVVSDDPLEPLLDDIVWLCKEAGVRHINMPRRTNDWGISPAMTGLRASVGDYVCFLSDDNAYLPHHFAPLVEALDADSCLGFAYSSCLYAGKRELRACPPEGAGIDLGQPLFRRSVMAEVMGDRPPFTGAFSWDWELINALMQKGVRWQHVDEPTFVFRLLAYPKIMEALA